MANMDPMETKQSMLEDPSKGSKVTMYLPLCAVSTSITVSFSSETEIRVRFERGLNFAALVWQQNKGGNIQTIDFLPNKQQV